MIRRHGIKKILFACEMAVLSCLIFVFSSCHPFKKAYHCVKGTFKVSYKTAKSFTKITIGSGKFIYKVGGFTFKVIKAPIEWPFTHKGIEEINGMPPKEAIKKGKVKNSPYVVNGHRYVPMSIEEAKRYRQTGIASWYGYETKNRRGGHMTANGEAFNPEGLTAAHKYLPLPTFVRVTNLENNRSIIVRVNDRGPFVRGRIIDLSAGAAKRLGFYRKGLTRVKIETIKVES